MILMPTAAMVIGFALAIVILNHYAAAPARRLHELVWGLSFLLFGAGAAFELAADLWGWNEPLARLYYLSGAILAVALLGIGELVLLAPRWWRAILIVAALFSLLTIVVVFLQPVDPSQFTSKTPWRATAPIGSLPAVLAGISNGLGTLLIVGGALYSAWVFWRRRLQFHRMVGCVLLAVGTFVVAAGGTLAVALGDHAWLYPPMAIGVAIMFVGYWETTRSVTQPQPAVTQALAGQK